MIARGPDAEPAVTDLLGEAAEAEGIPHALEVYGADDTDADEVHLARRGSDGARLDPARYMHCPSELVRSTMSRRTSA